MTEKPSTEYERLVQEVYQALHDAEHPGTVEVLHNERVPGRSGCKHQIDVLWKVTPEGAEGEAATVAIECKHLNKTVEVGVIRDFFGVLHDTGAKGIIATKHGFQAGARKFADAYGIGLVEVRPPEDDDWRGRVRGLTVEAIAETPTNVRIDVVPDEEWAAQQGLGDAEVQALTRFVGESRVVDEAGRVVVSDWQVLVNGLTLEEIRSGSSVLELPGHFLVHPDKGRLKIRGVRISNDVASSTETFTSDGDEVVRAILKEVKTGEIKLFDEDGGVR